MFLLMSGSLPQAARWDDERGVRLHVLHNVGAEMHALITAGAERIDAPVGNVISWQLINVLRSRSVPCAEAS
jgi:hypothetical protein